MKIYKSLKDLPTHKVGDFLIEKEDHYMWMKEPYFKLDKLEVEDNPEWFEVSVSGWDNGDTIFYLSVDLEIREKEFNALQHHKLVLSGNAFSNIDDVNWLKENIDKLLNDDDLIITDTNKIKKIISSFKSNRYKDAMALLMELL
jgi:hypothetical protein